ncbi:hypothetical protein N7493_011090 [Penicillium malachiteum]|uniref:ABC transporter domain-containing protein n=1 Tax=Penicillium malachiteum TaxID=1324776 RepID=A0AAD6HBG1_9EURO|nr:hypothetical protein N7493_011090 [Penicillium malachiteum]
MSLRGTAAHIVFYGPNNTATFPPEYCPPTIECFATRLQEAHNICDRPQGEYEPAICAPGFYCPSGGKSQIICPKGYFCPIGSVQPTPCIALSICPKGSSRQIYMIGFLCIILLDFFLAALVIYSARWKPPFIGKLLGFISISKLKRDSNFDVDQVDDAGSIIWDQNGTRQEFLSNKFLLSTEKVEISYQNISVRPRNSENMILFEQSGRIQPASFLGVMGFSGSGKSTLMNIISGRARPTTGHVFLNGRVAKPSQLRDLIGFVPQDDILLPDLTVRENIMHSARIRLGGVWNKHEIQEYVDSLIMSLGLAHVQHQLVGSPDNRRISGGERKRVNVGLELAAAPSMLILDEPTSGLDTTTALSLIVSLKALPQRGIAVICVVHQPRVEIFEAFDQLMVLDSGKQVYLDKAADAPNVFHTTTSHESLPRESYVNESASASIDGIKRQRAPWGTCFKVFTKPRSSDSQVRQAIDYSESKECYAVLR